MVLLACIYVIYVSNSISKTYKLLYHLTSNNHARLAKYLFKHQDNLNGITAVYRV